MEAFNFANLQLLIGEQIEVSDALAQKTRMIFSRRDRTGLATSPFHYFFRRAGTGRVRLVFPLWSLPA